MTAAQLAHLAELAALAADYFAVSDPDAARMFGDSASRAGDAFSRSTPRRNGGTRSELGCLPCAFWTTGRPSDFA